MCILFIDVMDDAGAARRPLGSMGMATNTTEQTRRNVAGPEGGAGHAVSTASALWAEGLRTAYASQDAAQTLAVDAFGRGQRFWWDQWRSMAEAGMAVLLPVTVRQLGERFEAAERREAERQAEVRTQLERETAELRESQREAIQAVREVVRETAREQRAGRSALEESIQKLDGRLDRLAKAQAKQAEELQAALAAQEQRLRERLGDRIRSAVDSIEAPKAGDLEEMRRQVAALGEGIAAIRGELSTLARDGRRERAASERSEPTAGATPAGRRAEPAPSK
jgi:hypothetical protein